MIIQLFNQPFEKVWKALPRLQRLGFTHVQISPPQKSHASRSWWGRYQPVDFRVIEGPLGSEGDLAFLCREAARRGIAVVADAVLSHMSNERRYVQLRGKRVVHAQYARFSTPDFRPRPGDPHAPRLDTRSPWVRSELRDYLRMLYGLGVRGFRFDAAKHIEPDFFPYVLEGMPPVLCFGELVYAAPEQFPPEYWESMKALDFPLAHALKRAFAPRGDLGSLVAPAALWGPLAVTFVNGHDLTRRRKALDFFRVPDARDRELAYLYVLGREDGLPLVYGPDLRSKVVQAGVTFGRAASGQPQRWVHADANTLVWARGARMLAGINKAGFEWRAQALACGLEPGRYRDLVGGRLHAVDGHGRWLDAAVPARGGVLLVGI